MIQRDLRKNIFYSAVVLVFLILAGRTFQLQIYRGEEFLERSETNRIRQVMVEPWKGIIFDRLGRTLVDNGPSYSVLVIPYWLQENAEVTSLLGQILDLDAGLLAQKIAVGWAQGFVPVKIRRDIGFQTLARLEENRIDLRGVVYGTEPKRIYPHPVAPHLLGYIGELAGDDPRLQEGYEPGDIVGKSGIEREYDRFLRGKKGTYYMEVDALGREIRPYRGAKDKAPLPGKNLYLTIDLDLQGYAEGLMDEKVGAVVALDPQNGEVLALVSKPDYNPNALSGLVDPGVWAQLQGDSLKPLLNRAIQAIYPPASTIKMVALAAALETGVISPDWKVNCPGYFKLGRRTFKCWKETGHGQVGVLKSIEESCDVFYWQLILKLGIETWADFARRFGFGQKLGIDLGGEMPGLIPDSLYYDRKYGEKQWTKGQWLNAVIGQGDVLITPLQLAFYSALVAMEGQTFVPHLLKHVESGGRESQPFTPQTFEVKGLSPATFHILKESMFLVVNGEHGTARWLKSERITYAGKTGTAENPHGDDHSLFIGFAPFENPMVAVSVVVEHGGHGSSMAAPIAINIMKKYLTQLKDEQKVLAEH